MADTTTTTTTSEREVPKRKVTVKNTSPKGQRFLFDATGRQHTLGPGQELEVEMTEPEAKRLEEQSKAGSSLQVGGAESEAKVERLEEAPEQPEEHKTRTALAEKERDLMEEGQEADKERREKIEKMTGPALAAETGIHMHARGLKPEVVASPPDAPPKKK
jgi:uncharacterized membrane protein